MGVTVTGAVRKSYPDLHDDVKVSRVFAQTMSGGWSTEDAAQGVPGLQVGLLQQQRPDAWRRCPQR